MYDMEIGDDNHRFYTNDILSHNSMWLNNISVKIADQGKNVLYVSLEMAEHKCIKRMGSQRLKIPIDQYNDLSKDETYMKNKINEMKYAAGSGGMFEQTPGKLIVKKFPTSSMTVTQLDNFIHKLEEVKKIKIHAVCVDYINIMGLEKGQDIGNMLFLKGKHFAEGLRYIADKHELAMITATQTDKSVWGGSDIGLKDIPESKAVAETSDVVLGIIRNAAMKKENKYILKVLKLRDGEYTNEQIRFDFNTKFLLMENDQFIGTTK
jgi:replicative DNA helicase